MNEDELNALIALYHGKRHDLRIFMDSVVGYIGEHPDLNNLNRQIVHSHKKRLKDTDHLKEKISRKSDNNDPITSENMFQRLTDLAGVRILHLYQKDFGDIDAVIRGRIRDGDWALSERPKTYTWDPENIEFFEAFDLEVSQKASFYTSVHYLVKPRPDSAICCEIQVRTLFEEIWGEVDHQINYPNATDNIACREQLMVLSKIVGAGSRILDSIQRVNGQH